MVLRQLVVIFLHFVKCISQLGVIFCKTERVSSASQPTLSHFHSAIIWLNELAIDIVNNQSELLFRIGLYYVIYPFIQCFRPSIQFHCVVQNAECVCQWIIPNSERLDYRIPIVSILKAHIFPQLACLFFIIYLAYKNIK